MLNRLQAIDFGIKVVESTIACRPESPLDDTKKSRLLQNLKAYMKLFDLLELSNDIDNLISLKSSEFLVQLAEFIQLLKQRIKIIDSTSQNLDIYFFTAATITFCEIALLSIKQGCDSGTMLDLSAPFLNSAELSSRHLGVKTPDINITDIKNSDLNSLQTSLKVWLENLRQHSNKVGSKYNKPLLVLRGVIKGIPYLGPAIDALIFEKD